jgi:predicted RND superfamily exporter protein
LRVQGTVVGVREKSGSYTPVYRYMLPSGDTFEATSNTGSSLTKGKETHSTAALMVFQEDPLTVCPVNSYAAAIIGFIMLGGISVSNSIILVDVFNHIRKERRTFYALLKAGEERIRPILMTTLTTILGLAPLVFQKGRSGSLWSPLAITVIGGLSVSTVLVLFILPAFYLILQDGRSWFLEKMGKAVPSG